MDTNVLLHKFIIYQQPSSVHSIIHFNSIKSNEHTINLKFDFSRPSTKPS